ncbi:uncharacterized protein LOC143584859 [Bidens hawaiensis]|uniref:uncharacterized protein LOC143584859 n=1 Tax=Bidens hawaiensis TaxID=980011 RepID=UPI00404B7958
MEEGEPVAGFLSKVMKIVNHKRAYGEAVTDQTVVEKVPRSLPARWDHVVAAIEESKDLSRLSYDQLMGSLQAHETRVNRGVQTPVEEHVLQAKEEDSTRLFARRRGRSPFRSRGGSRGRGFGRGKSTVECYNCHRMGHLSRDCWSEPHAGAAQEGESDEDEEEHVHFALACDDKKNENATVHMANNNTSNTKDIWFLDSGCSNYMTGQKALFDHIDHSKKVKSTYGKQKKDPSRRKGNGET